jgi:hypothetical protein
MSNPIASILVAFLLLTFFIIVVRAGCFVLVRGYQLSNTIGKIAAEALGLAMIWPIEWLIDQAEKGLAFAADYREQRKIWRAEFRTVMPWDEFRRQVTGQTKPKRDDYTDALSLFGLVEPFTRPDMDARFKRIMQGVHPDTGGSDYLAQQVTTARALVLKRKGWKK